MIYALYIANIVSVASLALSVVKKDKKSIIFDAMFVVISIYTVASHLVN